MTLGLRRSSSLIISTLFGLARWQLLHYRKVQWIIVRRQEFEFLGCSLLVLWPCTCNLNVLSFSFLFAYFIGNQARQRASCMWECFVSRKLQDKLVKKQHEWKACGVGSQQTSFKLWFYHFCVTMGTLLLRISLFSSVT